MLQTHPGAALINCEDCQQFVYDLQTGRRVTVRQGPERQETPQRRLPGMPLQCGSCAKGSPAEAPQWELSAKNWKAYRLWREVRATYGRCVSPAMARDSIIRRNLAAIDDVVRRYQRT
ncbi:hypothetical protein [Blastopirellula retiformator]|uniref:hypothetical protein n=1 Tax=Blastopirellula retiformator TaxID=2527970 RepID=UPI0011B3BEA4|nr:hypothetical protein [Blastopirellula retiformator]